VDKARKIGDQQLLEVKILIEVAIIMSKISMVEVKIIIIMIIIKRGLIITKKVTKEDIKSLNFSNDLQNL
jgi:hypothetical protein